MTSRLYGTKGTAMGTPHRTIWSAVVGAALAAALACPAAFAAEGVAPTENETLAIGIASEGVAGEGVADDADAGDAGDLTTVDGTGEAEGASGEPGASAGTGSGRGESDAEAAGNASATDGASTADDASAATDAATEAAAQEAADSTTTAETGEATYAHEQTAEQNGVVLHVAWNDPVLGEETTFHVYATGGSGSYKFRMDAPAYADPGSTTYESVADPSREGFWPYSNECTSIDYQFILTATGTYQFDFSVLYKNKSDQYAYFTNRIHIEVADNSHPSIAEIVSNAVAQCDAEVPGGDYARALWLHDWLMDQLEYDDSLKWSSAESALTRGLGTCQAYESAYAKLLTAAGIENAETRDTYDGHTWNAVKMDDEWYQVDVTWDDSKKDAAYYSFDRLHLYFGLTDELMAIAHPGHAKIYTADNYATRSTSLDDNYFVRSGDAETWADSYADRIQQHLDAGENAFSIMADDIYNPPSIYGITDGITAYAINQQEWSCASGPVQLETSFVGTTFAFSASYSGTSNYLEISTYKPSADASSWTAPVRDGFAFAGWYTDATCSAVYAETTGQAYAKFVPVSELVRFTGCSLRDDGKGADKATLRFCYEFAVPSGARLSSAGWDWRNPRSGRQGRTGVANYWLSGGDAMVANLAFADVLRAGKNTSFDSAYEVAGTVSYVTADGTAASAAEPAARTQSVLGCAEETVAGGADLDSSNVTYAKAILSNTDVSSSSSDNIPSTAISLSVYSYKHNSIDSSTWSVPTLDGHAFAGWYSDAQCTRVYKQTYGNAYAKFVPVSELVRFTGCSLRDDGKGADKATLRFCYEFAVPSGARLSSAGWDWRNPRSGRQGRTGVANYWLSGGDAMVANLAFADVLRAGKNTSFDSAYEVAGTVSYVTADGTAASAAEPAARTQSVLGCAEETVAGGMSNSQDISYARAILGS